MFGHNSALIWAIAAVFAALCIGTVVRIVALRSAPEEQARSRLSSLRTWWILASLLATAIICGKVGAGILLGTAGLFALRELAALIGYSALGRSGLLILYGSLFAYYMLMFFGQSALASEMAPAVFLVVVGGWRAWRGVVDGYIRTTAAMIWGLLLFVYALSHAYLLLDLPMAAEPRTGRFGWLVYLILLTETNDIMQAVTGRRFGRTKITPRVSPNKSLEGLLGGVVATTLLAAATGPWLTTFFMGRSNGEGLVLSACVGMFLSVTGFLGDINMSGIKRDAGVKDGSQLLPGQGGMIDRVDSLTFTAPLFYYLVRIFA